MLISWVLVDSTFYWSTTERQEIWQPPCTIGELLVCLGGFLDSGQAEPCTIMSRGLPATWWVRNFTVSNYLFNFYVSHILVNLNENDIIAKTFFKFKKFWLADFRHGLLVSSARIWPGMPCQLSYCWGRLHTDWVNGKWDLTSTESTRNEEIFIKVM